CARNGNYAYYFAMDYW
nr:immunoglobulin heavy chain junction region [Mus musculus]